MGKIAMVKVDLQQAPDALSAIQVRFRIREKTTSGNPSKTMSSRVFTYSRILQQVLQV